MKNDQSQTAQPRRLVQRLNYHMHILRCTFPGEFDTSQLDDGFVSHGPVKGLIQGLVQPGSGHGKEVEVGLANGGLQIFAGFATEIQHITLLSHQHGGRRVLVKQELFNHQLQVGSGRQIIAFQRHCATVARHRAYKSRRKIQR